MPPKVWNSTFVGSDPVQDPTPIDQPGVFEALVFSDVSDPTQANALAEKVDACARLLGDKNNSPAKSICDILNRNHSTGDAQHVRYYNASDPTPVANKGFSYVKAGEFYYRDSSGNIVQITSVGKGLAGTLKESGGTLLPVGAVEDGQLLARVGAAIIGRMKCNLSASSDPGVGDDSDDDYGVGSIWVNTSATPTPDAFICLDPSVGAAVWEQINGGGSATSPLTTKGDIWGYDSADTRIPVGADGTVMTVDSSEAAGVKWAKAPITAPGARIHVSDGQPVNTINVGATDTKIMPEDEASITFNVPVAGTYKISFGCQFVGASTTSSQTKLVFDEGESNEQTIGYNDKWQRRTSNGGYDYTQFVGQVELELGDHTVTAYSKEVNGSGLQIVGSSSVEAAAPELELVLVSGSGAGGTVTDQTILSSMFTSTSGHTSWQDIDNGGGDALETTFTTAEGDDVLIIVHSGVRHAGTGTTLYGRLALDGSPIAASQTPSRIDTASSSIMCFSYVLENLSAGSHTVKVQGRSDANQAFSFDWTSGTTDSDRGQPSIQHLIFRGGYANMDSVLSKTADFNLEPEDSHRAYDNSGASGTVIGTLPAWELGLEYKFAVLAAQTLRVLTDSTSDNIRIAGSITAGASRYAEASTIGNTLTIRAVHGNVWLAFASNGTWTLST